MARQILKTSRVWTQSPPAPTWCMEAAAEADLKASARAGSPKKPSMTRFQAGLANSSAASAMSSSKALSPS